MTLGGTVLHNGSPPYVSKKPFLLSPTFQDFLQAHLCLTCFDPGHQRVEECLPLAIPRLPRICRFLNQLRKSMGPVSRAVVAAKVGVQCSQRTGLVARWNGISFAK